MTHQTIRAIIMDKIPIIAAEMMPLSSATDKTKTVLIKAQIYITIITIRANASRVCVYIIRAGNILRAEMI